MCRLTLHLQMYSYCSCVVCSCLNAYDARKEYAIFEKDRNESSLYSYNRPDPKSRITEELYSNGELSLHQPMNGTSVA